MLVRLLLAACGLETLVPASVQARSHHVRDDAPLRFPTALGLAEGAGAGLGRMSRGGGVEGRNARATSVLMAEDSSDRDPLFVVLSAESSLHRMPAGRVQAPCGASALKAEVDKLERRAAGDQLNAAPPVPVYLPTSRSVRRATEAELLTAADLKIARNARDVPAPILPCSLFTLDGGGPLVRSHVLYHAQTVPGRVNLQLTGCPELSSLSADVDSMAVNIRYVGGPLRALIDSAVAALPNLVRPELHEGELRAVLRASVTAGADAKRAELVHRNKAVHESASARAILLADGPRPAHLALAASDSILDPVAVAADAAAVVSVVYGCADGLSINLSDVLVGVAANGHVPISNEKPTVNPDFLRLVTASLWRLPTPDALATESVVIALAGIDYSSCFFFSS